MARCAGYDLELVDAMIQLGRPIRSPSDIKHRYVLHYPIYAHNPGTLNDWGDFASPKLQQVQDLTIDFVMQIGQTIFPKDMSEEPYMAFAVTYDDTIEGLLAKCQNILSFDPPTIE